MSLGVWPTRDEAQAVVDGAVELLAGDARTRMPGVTLRELGVRVVEERAKDLPRSAGAEGTRWRRILMAPFADDPIESLATPAIDRWARGVLRELPGSARPTLTLLSAICGQAIRDGLLKANPCTGITLRRPARVHEPWTYLVPDEQLALLRAPIDEEDALQIGCLLGSGVRDGEMFSLRLVDVHADDREPHIWIRYGSPFGPPKGKKHRKVPLFGLGLRSFVRWLEILPRWCANNPRGLAFPGPRGGFQQSGAFLVRQTRVNYKPLYEDRFHDALTLAGIVPEKRHDGRPVRAHDLRHTWAVSVLCGWWGGEPWRLEDICAALGHSSINVTHRYYAHLDGSRLAALAAQTPGLLAGDGRTPLRALPPAKAAPIALLGESQAGTRCSSPASTISEGYGPHNPPITREAAIAGLRALARGDLVGARAAAASAWDEAALCRIFEAVLDEQAEEQTG